jgi:hypothetical protein
MSTNTRIALAGPGVTAAIVAVLGLADKIDRWGDSQADYRRWVEEACLPAPGQTSVARNEGGRLTCTIFSRNDPGRVPLVYSSAVMEALAPW